MHEGLTPKPLLRTPNKIREVDPTQLIATTNEAHTKATPRRICALPHRLMGTKIL